MNWRSAGLWSLYCATRSAYGQRQLAHCAQPGNDARGCVLMLQKTRVGDFGKCWLSPLDLLEGGVRRQNGDLASGEPLHGRTR